MEKTHSKIISDFKQTSILSKYSQTDSNLQQYSSQINQQVKISKIPDENLISYKLVKCWKKNHLNWRRDRKLLILLMKYYWINKGYFFKDNLKQGFILDDKITQINFEKNNQMDQFKILFTSDPQGKLNPQINKKVAISVIRTFYRSFMRQVAKGPKERTKSQMKIYILQEVFSYRSVLRQF